MPSSRSLAVIGLSLGATLIAAGPAPAAATCKPKHAHTIAKHGGSALYSVETGEGDEYGTPTAVYGCLRGQHRATRLERFDSTVSAVLTDVRFAGHYVAFTQTLTDVACTKYQPTNPQCISQQRVSFNVRTGKRA